jgi:hypothetical protein
MDVTLRPAGANDGEIGSRPGGNAMTSTVPSARTALPPLSGATLLRILAAGIGGLIPWEIFARLIAPLWLGHPLEPTALIDMALGVSGAPAHLLHLLTGLVFFPAGYVLVVRPLATRFLPMLGWPVLGIEYGIALWVFAMFVMASLLGGAPPFLGFEPVAWASLVGHVLLGLGIAAVAARFSGETT